MHSQGPDRIRPVGALEALVMLLLLILALSCPGLGPGPVHGVGAWAVPGASIYIEGGNVYRFTDGQLHNDTGPAVELAGGSVEYWLNGVRMSPRSWRKATRPRPL